MHQFTSIHTTRHFVTTERFLLVVVRHPSSSCFRRSLVGRSTERSRGHLPTPSGTLWLHCIHGRPFHSADIQMYIFIGEPPGNASFWPRIPQLPPTTSS